MSRDPDATCDEGVIIIWTPYTEGQPLTPDAAAALRDDLDQALNDHARWHGDPDDYDPYEHAPESRPL